MRLLLINVGKKTEIRLPQGLFYLASAVASAGYQVEIHDEALWQNAQQSLDQILAGDAEIIGLSVYTVPWQLKRAEQISRSVKSCGKSLVVWGGWHPTLYPRHSILNENVDIVVRGPGEKPVCELLDALEHGRPLTSVSGLVIKQNGEIIETGPECLAPEYLYPRLNFELINLDTYLKRHDRGTGILQYITTRGCRANCSFCVMSRLFKHRLFRKPTAQIVSELQTQLQNHKINTIHFSDDNTFTNDQEALELCDIVTRLTHGKGIAWRCATRIDTLAGLSSETYTRLAETGCKGVVVGIESGSDRVLRLMRKGIKIQQTQKALKLLWENGLHMNLFSFLFGFTGETRTEAAETLALARKTRIMFPRSDITLHVYFPGASDNGWLSTDIARSLASRQSEIFSKYYRQHITNYRAGHTNIKILRYYFGAGRKHSSTLTAGLLRRVFREIVLLRIKYGIFILPVEYYLSNIFLKKIRRCLRRVKISLLS